MPGFITHQTGGHLTGIRERLLQQTKWIIFTLLVL